MSGENEAQPGNLNEQFTPERISIGFPWRLLLISVTVFGLAVLSYFGLRIGYRSYLDGRSEVLDKNLENLEAQVSVGDQEKFVNFYSQITNLKTVLGQHRFNSNIFAFLERSTIGAVYYASAEMSARDGILAVKGFGTSLDALAQQISVLEKAPGVKLVSLEDVSVKDNGVAFSLAITFEQDFLSRQTTL